MFDKKKCQNCNKKISKEYEFCPFCGNPTDSRLNEEDYGLLGKNDDLKNLNVKLPFGFNTMINTLMRELDKQFKELDKQIENEEVKSIKNQNIKKSGISISITHSNSENRPPEIKIKTFGNLPESQQIPQKKLMPMPVITEDHMKKLSGLPREEAKANVRRLSNKIIYEINVPGVNSLNDVLISQLENSIEVKAISKNKIHFKLIPINLPLKKYSLKDEKLILELEARE